MDPSYNFCLTFDISNELIIIFVCYDKNNVCLMSNERTGIERRGFTKPESMIYSELLVGGLVVKLPSGLTPYTTQRTMMAKILTSLKNKLNALIESPTGS
uniref:Uncharacterized protein n=1 Tax=Parascaris equorum TaxID=6256 RepID=A0A914R2L1_PAREQ